MLLVHCYSSIAYFRHCTTLFLIQIVDFLGCRWLNKEAKSVVYVEPKVKEELVQEDPYFEFLQKCETGE